ncbi:MAG: ABC transporter substrate-binding protein [Mycobacteriaceae bacterium]|nr:ABC transporter substrate-binding protein [Mycobacteriaceae bacterium]
MPVPFRRSVFACLAAALAALPLAACGHGGDGLNRIVRTTSNVAGAGVVGVDRDTRTACPLPAAPDPAVGRTRTIAQADGVAEAPADPQRVVVLDTQALDAACALGLWERIVGAVTLPGGARGIGELPRTESPQPRYLGYGVRRIASVGPVGAPDPNAIRGLHPDLIIGAGPAGPADWRALSAIAPTVFTGKALGWQQEFLATATALNREQAGKQALAAYKKRAKDLGARQWAQLTQASVLRFTDGRIDIEGVDSFAGLVLTDVGVARPLDQRGQTSALDRADLKKADGDLIYAILAGEAGKDFGKQVMETDAWRDLGAADDRRVFAVNDAIWTGQGLTAANSLLSDIEATVNGYVTN